MLIRCNVLKRATCSTLAEFSNSISRSALMSDHQLTTKSDLIDLFFENLQPASGLVNGARYIVEPMANNVLLLYLLNEKSNWNCLILPRHLWRLFSSSFSRTQSTIRFSLQSLVKNRNEGLSMEHLGLIYVKIAQHMSNFMCFYLE